MTDDDRRRIRPSAAAGRSSKGRSSSSHGSGKSATSSTRSSGKSASGKPATSSAKSSGKSASSKSRSATKSSRTGRPSSPIRGSVPAAKPRARRYRRSWRLPVGRSSVRIRAFMVALVVFIGLCVGRAFQLQALDAHAVAVEAATKMQKTRDLPAARGAIADRNGIVLAASEPAMLISVDPDMVLTNGADKRYRMSEKKLAETKAAPAAVAAILAKHLGGRADDYLPVLTKKNSRYEIIAKQVPAATWLAIQKDMRAGIDGDGKRPWWGLFADPDPIRTYPNRSLASNVVGFVNGEGKGVAGLEARLNDELDGEPGKEVYDSSTYGRIPLGNNVMTPPTDGVSYRITIDSDLQWFVEQALAEGLGKSKAKTGTAIVMNVNDGEILAMANGPSFDSSKPGEAKPGDLGNRAVTDAYEPGSVQKVLTMAALADKGLVTPDTKVVVPPRIASGAGYVRDAFEHGTINLTARGVIAQSSNIGTIELTRQMNKADLAAYLKSFGLGSKPGSGLPSETAGRIPKETMPDYTRDQISFGQGLSVSAVQMAAAVAAAVNGGIYHQPTILKSATAADGSPIELPARQSHRVVSEVASAATVNMMEAVITQMGKGSRQIPGYRTAGKSGTAQRFDPKCKCYNGYTASFVGVAPAEKPQLLVYVVLDQPANGNLGSELALPVVNNILKMALPRYNVLPSATEALKEPLTFKP